MEVYKIMARISLEDGVSPVLALISRNMLGLNASIAQIERGFGKWKTAALGVGEVLAGSAILGVMGKLVKAGEELVHQQELMRIGGLGHLKVAQATAEAYKISAQVQTTTAAENLQHLAELRFVFGHLKEAEQYLPQVSRANTILNSIRGGGRDEVWQLVKGLEEKNVTTNPALFKKYIDAMTQVVIATRGKVTPGEFYSAFKFGRQATMGWDLDFVTKYLPRLIQSMSGGGGIGSSGNMGPGNALMSAYAAVVQGVISKKAANEWAKFGLASSPFMAGVRLNVHGGLMHSEVHGIGVPSARYGIGGRQIGYLDVAGKGLFLKNPYEWVQKVLMPAFTARGITSDQAIQFEIGRLFQNRVAAQVITMMALQGKYHEGALSQFEKEARLQHGSMKTLQAYEELIKHDPTTVMRAFSAQWQTMITALGSPLVPPAISVMRQITGVFTALGQVAGAHARTFKYIGEIAVGLGVFLGATGIATLASLVAPLVGAGTAVFGLVAAFGALAALNWSATVKGLQGAWTEFKYFAAFDWKGITGGLHAVLQAIEGFAAGIWKWLGKEFQLPKWMGGSWTAPPSAHVVWPGGPPQMFHAVVSDIGRLVTTLGSFAALNWAAIIKGLQGVWGALAAIASEAWKSITHPKGNMEDWWRKESYRSFAPAPSGGNLLRSIDWTPPSTRQATPIYVTTSLNVDGRTLAEVMSSELAALMMFPTQAPYPNGRTGWWPPDQQMTTT